MNEYSKKQNKRDPYSLEVGTGVSAGHMTLRTSSSSLVRNLEKVSAGKHRVNRKGQPNQDGLIHQ